MLFQALLASVWSGGSRNADTIPENPSLPSPVAKRLPGEVEEEEGYVDALEHIDDETGPCRSAGSQRQQLSEDGAGCREIYVCRPLNCTADYLCTIYDGVDNLEQCHHPVEKITALKIREE